jgi:hypothetical protein
VKKRRYWKQEEEANLREIYATTLTAELCAMFDRSIKCIYNKAVSMGLKKSPELIRAQAVERLTGPKSVANRFQKGCATWNKGMKGLDIGGKETRFKPGNFPQTWKPIGSERIDSDGYVYRKVSDTRNKKVDWVMVHVLLWEQHNGPVPAGCAVVFKDGDKKNIDIENLECITRAELMRRNTVHRLPKELAELIQLRGALNRQINRRTEK